MEFNSDYNVGESSQSSILDYIYDSLSNNASQHFLDTTCTMCQTSLFSIGETSYFDSVNICGDCKFLLLEGHDISSPDPHRMSSSSRIRYGSSEPVNVARRAPSSMLEDNQSVDSDAAARLVQRSTRTTPSGSRRWRRVFSDTESDGFDSAYGETESNMSMRRIRLFHGDADTVSYSAYGGESDVDGQSVVENDMFGLPGIGSELDSDTDIDPMNAGLYQWNSEDEREEEEDDDESEWEEADVEGNNINSLRDDIHGPLRSNRNDFYAAWGRRLSSPEVGGALTLGIGERMHAHTDDFLANFEETLGRNNLRDSRNYLDSRGFEALLDHLTETENSRRGAPPTAESFIKNIPHVEISEDHKNVSNISSCAICKESMTVGTVVNQLPCLHLYHPNCILPWLNSRNTCPLCRYELPTDDQDYEERKRNDRVSEVGIFQTRHLNDEISLDASYNTVTDEPSIVQHSREPLVLVDADSVSESRRNRWFLIASVAAPVVSMVGVSLMLWFGKPLANRRWASNRRESTQRRWWSFL